MDLRAFATGDEWPSATTRRHGRSSALIEGRTRVASRRRRQRHRGRRGLRAVARLRRHRGVHGRREFGLPEVKRGLFPAGGGTFLGTRIPLGIALEMTLTGDSDRRRARPTSWGWSTPSSLPTRCWRPRSTFAERIAAQRAARRSRRSKSSSGSVSSDTARARERLRELQPVVFGSEDAKEGAAGLHREAHTGLAGAVS